MKENQGSRSAGGGAVFVANRGSFSTNYSSFIGNKAVYTALEPVPREVVLYMLSNLQL